MSKVNIQKTNTIFGLHPDIFVVLTSVIGLVFIGLVTLRSIENADLPFIPNNIFARQIAYLIFSVLVSSILISTNYLRIGRYAYLLFSLTLVALLLLLLLGRLGRKITFLSSVFPNINGAYRWIRLGPIQFQPSEFLKITYILALARFLRFKKNVKSIKALLGPFIFTLIPITLIILEPDLGTVMLLIPTLLTIMFIIGVRIRDILIIIILSLISTPGLFMLLRPYQRARIAGIFVQSEKVREFLKKHKKIKDIIYPNKDLSRWYLAPEGYQLYHSKMAIGSANLVNINPSSSPFLKGRRRFPHSHNDFIFPMVVQRFGLIGGYFLLVLYLTLILGLGEIAFRVTEPFGRLIVVGSLSLVFIQSFVNIAMTTGLMPITGITLPFVSYGGSSLLTYFILISLCISVGRFNPPTLTPKPFE